MDYERQQNANLLSFYTDDEMEKKRNILLRLIEETSKENVIWALLCFCAIYFRGVVDEYHDYDVLIEHDSVNKFIEIFKTMGGKIEFGQNGKEAFFNSKVFGFGEIDGVEFDLISGFTVTTYGTSYCYELKKEEIEYIKGIPICPAEANFILYGMMIPWQPKRRFKYEIVKEYLLKNGVCYPEILKAQNLPKFIRDDISKL